MEHRAQIGKYEIVGVAGKGNMGTVYEGYDPFTDTKVAIKLCPITEGSGFRLARKMFYNEAHTAGALDHANILSVLDAGEHEQQPYIVMEYVAGGETLRSRINPQSLLPPARTVEILYQCAKALDYAHRRGVIHRDIKPSNIMMTSDGAPKIGDFGIAHHALSDATQVLGMLGSPRYMSPEQAQEGDLTHRTDLYSLGVVAYELLCGHPPFLAGNITALARKIVNEPPRPLRDHRTDLPPALIAIVERAMAKDPGQRFASGQEMALELAAVFGDGEHPMATPEPEEALRRLRSMHFFNDFSDAEVRQVLAAGSWLLADPGARIIDEDASSDGLYLLTEGRASVRLHGREIGKVAQGECFGEMALIKGQRRCAAVIAEEECLMLRIEHRLIERAPLECQLRFAHAFQRSLAERLMKANTRTHDDLASGPRHGTPAAG